MALAQKTLGFFIFATLGSALASLGAFLSIETYFHSIKYLGMALSLRTLSSCLFGFNATSLIQKLGLKNSFFVSQFIAFFSLAVLFTGFYYHQFYIVLLGLILIGLPITFSTILLTITFKMASSENNIYRKYSGSRELIFGIARLCACLLAPLLLFKFNLDVILTICCLLFVISGMFLLGVHLRNLTEEHSSKPVLRISSLISSRNTWIYVCQTTASFLLAALIPILASSNNISFTQHLPPLLRQSLWAIESITMILASAFYLLANQFRNNNLVKTVLMLNGFLLTLILLSTSPAMIMLVVTLISISMMLSFYIFRDDYVITADNDAGLLGAHAAFSAVQKDFIYSISPVLLAYLLTNYFLQDVIVIVLVIQFTFFIITKYLQRFPK